MLVSPSGNTHGSILTLHDSVNRLSITNVASICPGGHTLSWICHHPTPLYVNVTQTHLP